MLRRKSSLRTAVLLCPSGHPFEAKFIVHHVRATSTSQALYMSERGNRSDDTDELQIRKHSARQFTEPRMLPSYGNQHLRGSTVSKTTGLGSTARTKGLLQSRMVHSIRRVTSRSTRSSRLSTWLLRRTIYRSHTALRRRTLKSSKYGVNLF